MAQAQDSGARWQEWFVKWNQSTASWRTSQACLFGGWIEFSETWPTSGSMRDGRCYRHPMLERHTSDDESGSSAPTRIVKFPTLAARDYRHPNKADKLGGDHRGNTKSGKQLPNAIGGAVNARWAEWLLGFPDEWTVCDESIASRASGIAKSRSA